MIKTKRNAMLDSLRKAGASYRDLAKRFRITAERCRQIVKREDRLLKRKLSEKMRA